MADAAGRDTLAASLEQLIEDLTRGNVTEVKVILASVALALGIYQLLLITVGYGKVRPRFLTPPTASFAHRAVGDVILVLVAVTAVMCVSYFGLEEDAGLHVVAAIALLVVLAAKVAVVRIGGALGRLLPGLGISVWLLLALTWLTSAGDFLGGS